MKSVRWIFILLCLVAAVVAVRQFSRPSTQQVPEQALEQELSSGTDKQEIRVQVEAFGRVLKEVSLLAPTVEQDIPRVYEPYLSRSLLSSWAPHPDRALGRQTSSPWPQRIDVVEITPRTADAYTVRALVVMVTSEEVASGGDAGSESITFSVIREEGVWKIDSYEVTRQNAPNTERSAQDRPQLE